jgi:L-fuconolactonase
MDRRVFLGECLSGGAGIAAMSAVAAAGPAGLPGPAELRVPEALDIIDCHTHFYDPARPEGIPWPEKGSSLYRTVLPKDLRALPQFRLVTGTVIVEASSAIEDNAWLLDLAKDDPFIAGVVGHLKPEAEDFADQVSRFAMNPLFRGIRISVQQLQTMLLRDDFRSLHILADHDLSLDVNGGPETPEVISQVAAELPSLRFVLNHIGNVAINGDAPPATWRNGIEAAAKHLNVFCKISALVEGASRDGKRAPEDLQFYRPYIDVVWNAFGDERVIYGSNWPVSERAADYAVLQKISLSYAMEKGPEAARRFCSLNAQTAYKWVERPGRLKAV